MLLVPAITCGCHSALVELVLTWSILYSQCPQGTITTSPSKVAWAPSVPFLAKSAVEEADHGLYDLHYTHLVLKSKGR